MKSITQIRSIHTAKARWLAVVCRSPSPPSRAERDRGRSGRGPARPTQIKHPKLKDGVLSIEGTKRSDRIALRLQAGNPGVLQLDVDDDGSADFGFARGDDRTNRSSMPVMATTSSASTRATGSSVTSRRRSTAVPETTASPEARARDAARRRRERLDRRKPGQRHGVHGRRRRQVRLGSGRRQRRRRGPGRRRHDALQRRSRRRAGRSVGEREPAAVLPHPANITMDTAGVERVDFNALGGADIVTVNDLTGTGVTR